MITIEDIKNCEVYLGDIILQLLNMDLDTFRVLELVGMVVVEPIEPRYFLKKLIELFKKHKKFVYDDLSDYMQGILNDVLYGLDEKKVEEHLLNYKILLDNNIYKVKHDCLQVRNKEGKYEIRDVLYLTNIDDPRDNFMISEVMFKDGGYKIIYNIENVSQSELFENVLKYDKDFDFLLIGSASGDRHSTLNFNLYNIIGFWRRKEMTNKEFIDYLEVSKRLNLKECDMLTIEDIVNCEVYLGDLIMQLLNMDLEVLNVLEFVSILSLQPIKQRYFLEEIVKLLKKHKELVYDDLSDYMMGILNDIRYRILDVDEHLLNYRILLDEKFVKLDDKVYKIKKDSLQFKNRKGQYEVKDVLYLTNVIDSKDTFMTSGILFKDNGYKIIHDSKNKTQTEIFREVLESEKDFDFLLISSASGDRQSTLNFNLFRVLELLKNA